MTTTLGRGRKQGLFTLTTAALFGAALLVGAVSPASAKDHGNHGRGSQGNQNHGRQVQAGHYRVPQVIAVEHRGDYRPYFTGRSYYGPHQHYHAAYRFPVWVNGAVTYRSYSYCGDRLFVGGGAVVLPQLAIGFSFGQPGLYVGGYYGAPPPAYYYEEPRYVAPVYVEPRRHCDKDHDHDRYDD